MREKSANSKAVKYLFKALFILAVAHVAILPTGNRILKIAFCGVEILLLFLMSGIRLLRHPVRAADFGMLVTVVGIMIWNVLMHPQVLSFDVAVSLACMVCFLMAIITRDYVKIDRDMLRFLRRCAIVLTALMAIYSFLPFAYLYKGRIIQDMTLGFTNANLTGIYLFLIYALLNITRTGRYKFTSIALEAVMLYLIILTGSRAAILAAVIMPVLRFFMKRKIPTWIAIVLCAFPFLFYVMYMALEATNLNISLLGETVFTGREYVFRHYLAKIDTFSEVLFGSFERDILDNAHNAPVAIYTSLGLIGAVAVYKILIGALLRSVRESRTEVSQIAIMVILTCFVHSSTEAFLFLGEYPGVLFVYVFYAIAATKSRQLLIV